MSEGSPAISLADDPVLPQRDLMLDPEQLGARAAQALAPHAGPVEVVRVRRVKYRIGDSLRVVLDLRVGDQTQTVAARTYRPDRARNLFAELREAARPVGGWAGLGHDDELATIFWTFPNDRGLDPTALLDPTGPLRRYVGPRWVTSALAGYMPEKLATVACLDADGVTIAYAKVFAGDTGARTARIHRRLVKFSAGQSELRVPVARAWVRALRTLVLEPAPGTPLAHVSGDTLVRGVHDLGRALAVLHGAPAPRDAVFDRHDVGLIIRTRDFVSKARPDVAVTIDALASRLLALAPEIHSPNVCVHGDAHLRNVLVAGDGVALVDLDDVARGPAASDLGGLLAAFSYRSVIGDWPVEIGQRLSDALRAGYEARRPYPPDRVVRWHTATAMLNERALRAVNRVRVAGLSHLDALLRAAFDMLDGADGGGGRRA